jgi:hypothetical protein
MFFVYCSGTIYADPRIHDIGDTTTYEAEIVDFSRSGGSGTSVSFGNQGQMLIITIHRGIWTENLTIPCQDIKKVYELYQQYLKESKAY